MNVGRGRHIRGEEKQTAQRARLSVPEFGNERALYLDGFIWYGFSVAYFLFSILSRAFLPSFAVAFYHNNATLNKAEVESYNRR